MKTEEEITERIKELYKDVDKGALVLLDFESGRHLFNSLEEVTVVSKKLIKDVETLTTLLWVIEEDIDKGVKLKTKRKNKSMIKLMSTQEVASRLGIGDRRVRKMINAGTPFPTVVVQEGGKRRLGVRPEVLENYLKTTKKR